VVSARELLVEQVHDATAARGRSARSVLAQRRVRTGPAPGRSVRGAARRGDARPALADAGSAYLLALAWRAFLDSDDVVEGVDVHPAVLTVARLLRLCVHLCGAGRHTTELAAALQAGFGSYAQFHRVFRAETGARRRPCGLGMSRRRTRLRPTVRPTPGGN
jgi:AraC-like DNA-binding protein